MMQLYENKILNIVVSRFLNQTKCASIKMCKIDQCKLSRQAAIGSPKLVVKHNHSFRRVSKIINGDI